MADQQLERYLKPGRRGQPGPRLTVAELTRRYQRNVPDPYVAILSESDSLLLTPSQVSSVQQLQTRYRQRMDSLWLDLATYLAALGDTYDVASAVKRQEEAIAEGREISRLDVQKLLPQVLTPVQLRILPYPASMFYSAKTPITPSGRTLRP